MNMEYVLGQLTNLLAIDSPSGYTKDVTDYLLKEFETLGFPAHRTVKGGVIADLGGEDADNAIFVESHVDTLGAMVTKIKDNGCLEVSRLVVSAPIPQRERRCVSVHGTDGSMRVHASSAMLPFMSMESTRRRCVHMM